MVNESPTVARIGHKSENHTMKQLNFCLLGQYIYQSQCHPHGHFQGEVAFHGHWSGWKDIACSYPLNYFQKSFPNVGTSWFKVPPISVNHDHYILNTVECFNYLTMRESKKIYIYLNLHPPRNQTESKEISSYLRHHWHIHVTQLFHQGNCNQWAKLFLTFLWDTKCEFLNEGAGKPSTSSCSMHMVANHKLEIEEFDW